MCIRGAVLPKSVLPIMVSLISHIPNGVAFLYEHSFSHPFSLKEEGISSFGSFSESPFPVLRASTFFNACNNKIIIATSIVIDYNENVKTPIMDKMSLYDIYFGK